VSDETIQIPEYRMEEAEKEWFSHVDWAENSMGADPWDFTDMVETGLEKLGFNEDEIAHLLKKFAEF
jgi:hypothetical protein